MDLMIHSTRRMYRINLYVFHPICYFCLNLLKLMNIEIDIFLYCIHNHKCINTIESNEIY